MNYAVAFSICRLWRPLEVRGAHIRPTILTEARSSAFVRGRKRVLRPHLHAPKEKAVLSNCFWCGRRDLNPYVGNTRPSNVRVCRFRHSRICFCSLGTLPIIAKHNENVKPFFENFLKNFLVRFTHKKAAKKRNYIRSRHILITVI